MRFTFECLLFCLSLFHEAMFPFVSLFFSFAYFYYLPFFLGSCEKKFSVGLSCSIPSINKMLLLNWIELNYCMSRALTTPLPVAVSVCLSLSRSLSLFLSLSLSLSPPLSLSLSRSFSLFFDDLTPLLSIVTWLQNQLKYAATRLGWPRLG